jgi:type IV secretory pathway VirB9-like protein
VLVKPHAAGLRTNIVLITDRRTYLQLVAKTLDHHSASPFPLADGGWGLKKFPIGIFSGFG